MLQRCHNALLHQVHAGLWRQAAVLLVLAQHNDFPSVESAAA